MATDPTVGQAFVDALTPYLVDAALAVFTVALGFVGRAIHGFVNAHKNDKNFQFLTSVATVAVQAAEQMYGSDGQAKLDFATKYVQAELDKRNIKVDVEDIRAQVEAAVLAEFNYPQAVEPATAPASTDVVSTSDGSPEVVVTTPVDSASDVENEDVGDTV